MMKVATCLLFLAMQLICITGDSQLMPSLTLMVRTYHKAANELWRLFLPSYQLFWPQVWKKSDLVIVLDAEDSNDHRFGAVLSLLPPFPQVVYEKMPPEGTLCDKFRRIGYARQMYSNFYADNLTNADFIGIFDTDAVFTAPVTAEDLFSLDDGQMKPKMMGINGCCTEWQAATPYAIGSAAVADFMVDFTFPFVVRRQDFPKIREHVRATLNKSTFDEAYSDICNTKKLYSQFDIMGNYLWHHQRSNYDWHLWRADRLNHPRYSKLLQEDPEVLAAHRPTITIAKHIGHSDESSIFSILPEFIFSASEWQIGRDVHPHDQQQVDAGVAYNSLTGIFRPPQDYPFRKVHQGRLNLAGRWAQVVQQMPDNWTSLVQARKTRLFKFAVRWPTPHNCSRTPSL
eukprot:GGOE01019791.1.p1 GENE.GGOE01019791.1~~GGOE01019791.1.p1  ORF type:complete len:407 (-),score=46.66 GGOE01019791.1:294-1493(-)